jgi:predicted  nucleic acid-binding Zn ribbon protein
MCGSVKQEKSQRCPECERQMENSFDYLFCAIDKAVCQIVSGVRRDTKKNYFAQK